MPILDDAIARLEESWKCHMLYLFLHIYLKQLNVKTLLKENKSELIWSIVFLDYRLNINHQNCRMLYILKYFTLGTEELPSIYRSFILSIHSKQTDNNSSFVFHRNSVEIIQPSSKYSIFNITELFCSFGKFFLAWIYSEIECYFLRSHKNMKCFR